MGGWSWNKTTSSHAGCGSACSAGQLVCPPDGRAAFAGRRPASPIAVRLWFVVRLQWPLTDRRMTRRRLRRLFRLPTRAGIRYGAFPDRMQKRARWERMKIRPREIAGLASQGPSNLFLANSRNSRSAAITAVTPSSARHTAGLPPAPGSSVPAAETLLPKDFPRCGIKACGHAKFLDAEQQTVRVHEGRNQRDILGIPRRCASRSLTLAVRADGADRGCSVA